MAGSAKEQQELTKLTLENGAHGNEDCTAPKQSGNGDPGETTHSSRSEAIRLTASHKHFQ